MSAADLRPFIGLPGGPRSAWEADRQARHEEQMQKYDRLGAGISDDRERRDVKPDCVCRYCRFYRGEGGVRLVMCEQDWDALPPAAQVEIAESCAD